MIINDVNVIQWDEIPEGQRVAVKAYALYMCITCSSIHQFRFYYAAGTGRHKGKNVDRRTGKEKFADVLWHCIKDGDRMIRRKAEIK